MNVWRRTSSMKYVYLFKEGDASMRNTLGGKGANLAEMTKIGLPVPQGFTISTEACTQYYEDGRQINADIQAEIIGIVKAVVREYWDSPPEENSGGFRYDRPMINSSWNGKIYDNFLQKGLLFVFMRGILCERYYNVSI